MPKKYEGLYCWDLLDREIEKIWSWVDRGKTPHSEWIPANSHQTTREVFGLIDPIPAVANTNEKEAKNLVVAEDDAVVTLY